MLSIVAAVLAISQNNQETPIGRLSESEFLKVLAGLGCRTEAIPGQGQRLFYKGASATCYVGNDEYDLPDGKSTREYVRWLSARVEFSLPQMLNRDTLDILAKRQKEFSEVLSLLDGRVTYDCLLWSLESREKLQQSLDRFFEGLKGLSAALAPYGGKLATNPFQIGGAPLDMTIRLKQVEESDMMFIAFKLGWRENFSGGTIRHWNVSSEPLGQRIELSRPSEHELEGNGLSRPGRGFFMRAHFTPSNQTATEWVDSVGSTLHWAKATAAGERVQIRGFVDTSSGPTVGDIVNKIEAFAQNVKDLD